jgi:TfoX/Sxy family transcriptional regulator of competence genes
VNIVSIILFLFAACYGCPLQVLCLQNYEKSTEMPKIRKIICNFAENIMNMASKRDFVDYIADQCSGAGEITVKKMFGDYGIYCDGKIFGLICDDCFYLKSVDAVRPLLRTVDLRPPYDGAKDYFYIADVDDHDYLSRLVCETCKALPEPKPQKKKP